MCGEPGDGGLAFAVAVRAELREVIARGLGELVSARLVTPGRHERASEREFRHRRVVMEAAAALGRDRERLFERRDSGPRIAVVDDRDAEPRVDLCQVPVTDV